MLSAMPVSIVTALEVLAKRSFPIMMLIVLMMLSTTAMFTVILISSPGISIVIPVRFALRFLLSFLKGLSDLRTRSPVSGEFLVDVHVVYIGFRVIGGGEGILVDAVEGALAGGCEGFISEGGDFAWLSGATMKC